MDPETQPTPQPLEPFQQPPEPMPLASPAEVPEKPYRGLKWVFIGPQGLRAGWSVLIVVSSPSSSRPDLSYVVLKLHLVTRGATFTPKAGILRRTIPGHPAAFVRRHRCGH